MKGFTKAGQPIQGRRYVIHQGGGGTPEQGIEVRVVGKAYGKAGNADLVGVWLEDKSGAREFFDWPIVSSDPEHPITFSVISPG